MLSAKAYLELLTQQHDDHVAFVPGSLGPNRGQRSRIRANQTGGGLYLKAAEQEREFLRDLELPHDARASDVSSNFLDDILVKPLLEVLDADERARLADVPVGLLHLRILNARAFQSPNGDPIIVMNRGLLNVLSEFKEMAMEAAYLSVQLGKHIARAYERACYRFIIEQFDGIQPFDNSRLSTPAYLLQLKNLVRLPEEVMFFNQLDYIGAEMFVLAHEFAHVSEGHLNSAAVRCVAPDGSAPSPEAENLDCYELSWQQEYEADRLGFLHYLKAWPRSSVRPEGLDMTPIEIIAPLSFFQLLHLVECNLPMPDAYGTHPPAWRRALQLIKVIAGLYDLSDPENANLHMLCRSFLEHLVALQRLNIRGESD